MNSTERHASLDFQERDFDVLRGLFESRVMTLDHMAALYFGGRKEAAKKRIQKLKAAGFIGERKRRVNDPAVHFLTVRAFKFLTNEGRLTDYPKISTTSLEKRVQVSPFTLRHELEVMDVKAALCAGIAKTTTFKVAEFSTWPLLYQFTARRPTASDLAGADVLQKPDGFIRIHETEADGGLSEHTFFLEVDRSTENLEKLALKASCYNAYYRDGGLAVRNGKKVSDYRDFPFRVLFVLKSAERRDNTAKRLLQNHPPVLTQVWVTTLQQIVSDPLGRIWRRPLDARAADHRSNSLPANGMRLLEEN